MVDVSVGEHLKTLRTSVKDLVRLVFHFTTRNVR
jgi:hypothetical protein